MDNLTKEQKDEYATCFAILALYDGNCEITSDAISNLLSATGNKEVEAYYPTIFANFLSDPEKVIELITTPGGSGGGDGGAAGGGADGEEAEVEEEEPEEEEADIGGGMDMFGGGDDGDY
mmetsp:Transcript_9807/g.12742  ORF Transcript_9807/g.12742 Transcript_9807/m.12742 type:complete len:120 (+) Transcript_9807:206-565(+)|eukprot:CAMPEP_0116061430 /NCGR_PEP_ID=MMETSP0322-20121206/7085_1 /TAXON_ID=163516 /ORGANISM="Leptocylindrus danicus var. apora, Strain B651" /LENGTH=119 /DNA_ID=CAMNT_0003546397 /DNA_START=129 /DNA_END=488 /DNA_ORIENTATION=+